MCVFPLRNKLVLPGRGAVFVWAQLGQPSSTVAIDSSLGAKSSQDLYRTAAWCFCLGSDGNVWSHSSTDESWRQTIPVQGYSAAMLARKGPKELPPPLSLT